jgi:transcriptional regulator with XRE-family HTH domain
MSKGRKQTFGSLVRQERGRLKIGLRDMARRIGVSPTYLSMIERDALPPPAEDKVTAIAKIIGGDRDELLALAGKVSSDLQKKIKEKPRATARLIHSFSELSREDQEGLEAGNFKLLLTVTRMRPPPSERSGGPSSSGRKSKKKAGPGQS